MTYEVYFKDLPMQVVLGVERIYQDGSTVSFSKADGQVLLAVNITELVYHRFVDDA